MSSRTSGASQGEHGPAILGEHGGQVVRVVLAARMAVALGEPPYELGFGS